MSDTREAARRAFLRQICSYPEDDAARLVYADWLEEFGEPEERDHAELIRLQVALAGSASAADSPQVGRQYVCEQCTAVSTCDACSGVRCVHCGSNRMRKCRAADIAHLADLQREHQLLEILAPEFKAALPGTQWALHDYESHLKRAVVRRGFVYKVWLSTAGFLDWAKVLFEAHPVTNVVLTDRRPAVVPNRMDSHDRPLSRAYWFHHSVPGPAGPAMVPAEILGGRRRVDYATATEAHAGLSGLCVAYGRKRAGLPPLGDSVV